MAAHPVVFALPVASEVGCLHVCGAIGGLDVGRDSIGGPDAHRENVKHRRDWTPALDHRVWRLD